MTADAPIPVFLLTGFLGSGKTTLLNRLLSAPQLTDTAVVVNEFGEIALDHLLIHHSSEQITLLDNGCLCCTVRGDLVAALATLRERRTRGEIPFFRRVIIETTGLADPAPILHTLLVDPQIAGAYVLATVVTTADAVNGLATIDRQIEARKQIAVADKIVITKGDIAPAANVATLRASLLSINPTAAILEPDHPNSAADTLLRSLAAASGEAHLRDWEWLSRGAATHQHHEGGPVHDNDVKAHCFSLDLPVDRAAFLHWLELLAAARGDELLRVKGIVADLDRPESPFIVHGVQHVFHPPIQLDAWPSEDRRTRLVFIGRDISRAQIETSLRKFGGIDGRTHIADLQIA